MWSKSIEIFNPYGALKKSKTVLEFKLSIFKLKPSQWKLIKLYLKVLRIYICRINKIGIPTSKGEIVMMETLLSAYDETIIKLNESVDEYRDSLDHARDLF